MPNSPERGRIAYFALDLPHKGQGSYIHIHEIVNNLRRIGWQVDLFAPKPSSDGRRHRFWRRALLQLATIGSALKRLGGHDVLYVRAHPGAWPVTMAARRRNRLITHEVNGTEIDVIVSRPWLAPLHRLVRWLYRSQYRVADHLFPVAEEMVAWLREGAGHERITVVSNAANTDLFRPIEREAVKPFVVFFGGLTAWHGIDTMIAAAGHARWPLGVELVIIGTGAREKDVAAAARSNLPIRWLGYQPNEEIPRLIAGALAGLIPITDPRGRSSTGMHPLKLYETLACGIAAIVSDLPGQADLVRTGRCGLIFPPGDAAALADAVARLAADPVEARAMGDRGAALVRGRHSWASRAAVIDDVLCKLLRERAATGRPIVR